MSIGEDLAAARHQAALSVTQVNQQTCIRETIIRAIEHDDYAVCGGDFYARGHIRAIAHAVGADPGPLIAAYDAAECDHLNWPRLARFSSGGFQPSSQRGD